MRVRRDAGMETYAWRDHPRIVTNRVPVRVGRSHASPRSSLACQPRVSGSTVPYEVIFDHFETVLATLAADPTAKGLPGYVTMRWLGESQDTIAEPLFHQRRDLAALAEVEVREGDHWSRLRTGLQGGVGTPQQAVGVTLPPPGRSLRAVVPRPARSPTPLRI